jgi:hypothetical protein
VGGNSAGWCFCCLRDPPKQGPQPRVGIVPCERLVLTLQQQLLHRPRVSRARLPAAVRLSPAISFKSYPLHPSFTEFSTRFSPLYLISLQQYSLNLVLYTLNAILETYFVPNFCTYVFIIPQMLWIYFIFI